MLSISKHLAALVETMLAGYTPHRIGTPTTKTFIKTPAASIAAKCSHPKSVTPMPIIDVVAWTKAGVEGRLFLPAIQRSLVWRNSQIINYWDSLLRGSPAGRMMIHHPNQDQLRARTSDGNTSVFRVDDFLLFDGQQRLTAILLGLGAGQLKDHLKLWVDLGNETPGDSDLRFRLRISSPGQPFGHPPAAPNEKIPLAKHRNKSAEWLTRSGLARFNSEQAFTDAKGCDLIGSPCAVPLPEIANLVQAQGVVAAVTTLQVGYPAIPVDRLERFVKALTETLKMPIWFQLIKPDVIEHEAEYIRFFRRLGRGGTVLTHDELTYSIIKFHFPWVPDRMQEVIAASEQAGRLASEVNLVMAALRVAKVSAPWGDPGDWQTFGRPQPVFVSRLRAELPGVREEFQRLIPKDHAGRLKELLESISQRLIYDEQANPRGLPVILLEHLPPQLIDVLLLMAAHRQPQAEPPDFLPAFVLDWLRVIADSEDAANIIFQRFCQKEADWQPHSNPKLFRQFEERGIARRMPS